MEQLFSKLVSAVAGDKAAPAKDYWVDDSKVKACYECETPFSMLVRRHHCRICGRIFCANCTMNCAPAGTGEAPPGQSWQRICNYCHRMRQRDDDSSSEQRVKPSAVQRLLGNVHMPGPDARPHQQDAAAGTHESNGSSRPHGQQQHHHQHQLHSTNSLQVRGGVDASLTWEVPPNLDRNWGPALADLPPSSPHPAAGTAQAAAAGSTAAAGGSMLAAEASHAAGGAGSPSSGSSSLTIGALPQPGAPSSGLHPLVLLNRQEFGAAAEEHLSLMLKQLLAAEDVQQAEVWLPVLLQLVKEAATAVQPAAAAAFGENDPRFFVKVKRLPDVGAPNDSCVIKGVVAKKNVAHRRMRADIDDPAVLLLSGALEYQRVANKLSSFDTLLDQEREHLRLAVARIAACKPDVLLVERSVARAAQEELLNRGISLVHHTKPELLERLARCMGVKVANSVEELSSVFVGSCSKFKVELLPQPAGSAPDSTSAASSAADAAASAADAPAQTTAALAAASGPRPGSARPTPVSATPAPPKTLMYFDGCALPLGCTVLLRGASAAELTKVKRIVKFGVLAAYHLNLEVTFLAEELTLMTAALAPRDIQVSDMQISRSLVRGVIHGSLDSVNPCGLPAEDRLLLSMSPHVLVPGAWEQDERSAAHKKQQQQQESQQEGQLEAQFAAEFGNMLALQDTLQTDPRAAVAGLAEQQHIPAVDAAPDPLSTPAAEPSSIAGPLDDPLGCSGPTCSGSASDTEADGGCAGSQGHGEPEFTDPLRRRTLQGDEALLGEELGLSEQEMVQQEAQSAAAMAALSGLPLATQGLQLYDRQHVYLSMACRNPRRGLMCEPPSVKRIDLYCHSDLSLAGFIVAAAPHAHKKCQVPGCGDGVTCHVRTFLHGNVRLTLSIATLPSHDALPGEDRGQVWTWLRPRGAADEVYRNVRRLPLSQSSACMSLGMFLSLCFAAHGLEVFGRQLHSGIIRYFGIGRTVMCLHQDAIYPSTVELPLMRVGYSLNAQLMWLKQEAAELCQESNEVFDVLEAALQSHPYFKARTAAVPVPGAGSNSASVGTTPPSLSPNATSQPFGPGTTPPGDAEQHLPDESAGGAAGTEAAYGSAGAASGGETVGMGVATVVNTATMLTAVRKDRTTFMDQVAETVQRATPRSPTGHGVIEEGPLWDEQLMVGIQDLNRLRRSLTFTTLTWAAILQDPAYFTQKLVSLSATGPAAIAAAAAAATAAALPGSPLAVAAAAAAAAAAAVEQELEQAQGEDGGSAHGGSMFHLPAALAAQRMCISDDGSDVPSASALPLLPSLGPIAVRAVANLVAAEAVNSASTGGGLLAGSHGVMMAVTGGQRSSSNGGTPLAGTPGTCGTPLAVAAPAPDSTGDEFLSGTAPRSPRAGSPGGMNVGANAVRNGSVGSTAGLATPSHLGPGSRHLSSSLSANSSSSPRSAAAAAVAAALQRRTVSGAGSSMASAAAQGAAAAASAPSPMLGSEDGDSDDGDAAHDRFVAWMTSHEIQDSLDSDTMSDCFPEQLPDWDASAGDAASSISAAARAGTVGAGARTPTPPATPDMSAVAAAGGQNTVAPGQQQQLDSSNAFYGLGLPLRGAAGAEAAAAGSNSAAAGGLQQHSLAPIRTNASSIAAAAGPAGRAAGVGPGSSGFAAVPRVVLPGRAMMPAGINDTVVPIFDAEPTSVAAYFLSSRAYQQQLNAAMRQILHEESKRVAEESRRVQEDTRRAAALRQQQQQGNSSAVAGGGGVDATAPGGMNTSNMSGAATLPPLVPTQHSRTRSQDAGAAAASALAPAAPEGADAGGSSGNNNSSSSGPQDSMGAAAGEGSTTAAASASTSAQQQGSPRHHRTSSIGSSSSSSSTAAWRVKLRQQQAAASSRGASGSKQVQPDWLALLLSPDPFHVKHAFDDESPGMPWSRARFGVTAYFAPQFAELRRRCIVGGEGAYITSLCRCVKWASRGGKSNAYFAKTRDDRFIIKSLSKPEKASFLEFAPAYFEHMAHAAATNTPTTLAKIAGVYSISLKQQAAQSTGQGGGGAAGLYKDGSIDVLVMENIFYDRQISRIYDLKGSERSRFNADAAANPQDVRAVHLDDNLRRANLQAPLLVEQGMLRVMECALWADTSFLAGLGVMDYSLLVGVDREHNQLVVAIIDFIRTYTWDKQLETWVKSSGILGGAGKEPTIVSPKQYMRRFRSAISSYFTVVPDGRDMETPLDPDAP